MVARTLMYHHEVRTTTGVMWVNDEYTVVELDFGRGIVDIFNAATGAPCYDAEIWKRCLLHRTNEYFKRKGLL